MLPLGHRLAVVVWCHRQSCCMSGHAACVGSLDARAVDYSCPLSCCAVICASSAMLTRSRVHCSPFMLLSSIVLVVVIILSHCRVPVLHITISAMQSRSRTIMPMSILHTVVVVVHSLWLRHSRTRNIVSLYVAQLIGHSFSSSLSVILIRSLAKSSSEVSRLHCLCLSLFSSFIAFIVDPIVVIIVSVHSRCISICLLDHIRCQCLSMLHIQSRGPLCHSRSHPRRHFLCLCKWTTLYRERWESVTCLVRVWLASGPLFHSYIIIKIFTVIWDEGLGGRGTEMNRWKIGCLWGVMRHESGQRRNVRASVRNW